jgi:hypothetical protein
MTVGGGRAPRHVHGHGSDPTAFPSVTVAPAGMPGSPMVYAQPNPPQLYSG